MSKIMHKLLEQPMCTCARCQGHFFSIEMSGDSCKWCSIDQQ